MSSRRSPWSRPESKRARRPKIPSRWEETFALQVRAMGLPDPARELAFAKDVGRLFRFDFAWPGARIAVEIEGGLFLGGRGPNAERGGRHLRASGFLADVEKYNLAASLGWQVFRFTPREIGSASGVKMLRAALASVGAIPKA